jgi:hypothetical protein
MTRCGAVVLALTVLAPRIVAQRVVYEGGLTAATGEYYFTERTTTFGLSSGLSVRGARWTLRLTAPVWMQNTTLISSSGIGVVPTGGPAGQDAVRDSGQARDQRKQGRGGSGGPATLVLSGLDGSDPTPADAAIPAPEEAITGQELRLGDPILGANLRLLDGGRIGASVGAAIKAPLASSTTMGTGQWDYGANVSLSAFVGSRLMLGTDLAYWHLGDLDSLELRDPLLASLSIGALLGTNWAAMASLLASTSAVEGFDPPASVSLSLSRISGGGSWGLSVAAGLTESSPDVAFSINWSVPLSRGL